jgi:pimeloyl-ACP methyl ester carboxylesterase
VTAALWSEEAGDRDAPLLALVHGSLDRSAGLLKLSRRLDDRFRVLRYDRRGYGRSTPHDGPFGVTDQVADLVTLLDGRPAVVFGHSYGGNVALGLADRHPDLVVAVGVYEAPLPWLDWWPRDTAGGQAAGSDGDPADAAEWFMRRMVGDEKWLRLPARTRASRRAEGVTMVSELAGIRHDVPWDPARIGVPAVAMHGSEGREHHQRSAAHLGATLADCPVVAIEGARHFGPNSHPDAVAAALTELVSRTASRP